MKHDVENTVNNFNVELTDKNGIINVVQFKNIYIEQMSMFLQQRYKNDIGGKLNMKNLRGSLLSVEDDRLLQFLIDGEMPYTDGMLITSKSNSYDNNETTINKRLYYSFEIDMFYIVLFVNWGGKNRLISVHSFEQNLLDVLNYNEKQLNIVYENLSLVDYVAECTTYYHDYPIREILQDFDLLISNFSDIHNQLIKDNQTKLTMKFGDLKQIIKIAEDGNTSSPTYWEDFQSMLKRDFAHIFAE